MSAKVVRVGCFGDYLDYIYGGEDNVKNLSDEEVRSVLNVTTALLLQSDQLRLLCESAMECMSVIGYQASAEGQSELAEYTAENIREFKSMYSAPLLDSKVYYYNQAAVQTILMREHRMPHGVYIQWVGPGDKSTGIGGEVSCYVEPCVSEEAEE